MRSVSFPAADLPDVQDLSEEHGGISKLFQYLYRSLLDHRVEAGRDPSRAELAAAVHDRKAAEEARAEALAKIRKERAEARAEAARKRAALAETARADRAAVQEPPAKVAPVLAEPDGPLSYEEQVERAAEFIHRVKKGGRGTDQDAERALRARAKAHGLDPVQFVKDAFRVARGQTNLLALPSEVRS